jgi:hypothetical protein
MTRIRFGLGLGAALSLALAANLVSLTSAAAAQGLVHDPACGGLAARCPATLKLSSCIALRQRCGNGAEGAKTPVASGRPSVGMTQLDHPTDLPRCSEGQELVMVPTCRCASPLDMGAPSGALGTCATCSNDGVRLECQNAR